MSYNIGRRLFAALKRSPLNTNDSGIVNPIPPSSQNRITEEGIERVTEDGQTRITE